jgi:hypothetical protein
MAVCTYDNPATWRRECWQDGRLVCDYSAALLMQAEADPAMRLFFGANVGPWQEGQIMGDASAMQMQDAAPPQQPESEDQNQPLVTNPKAPGDLKVGDYVFASRWSDCDPGDPWHVGHVSEVGPDYVVVGDVSRRRWPRAMKITQEQGSRIVQAFPPMEDNWKAFNYKAIANVFGVDTEKCS